MKPTLLILAAGIGSRYGGLKQVDPVGPNGEAIIDYSIYDALQAGFKKIVFIIRKEFALNFQRIIGAKYKNSVEISYVMQNLQSNTRDIFPRPTSWTARRGGFRFVTTRPWTCGLIPRPEGRPAS